jgi:hypothetical protein
MTLVMRLIEAADDDADEHGVPESQAWGRMFALVLMNLLLHMNEETYVSHLRHARAHIDAELEEMEAQVFH